MKVSTNTIRQLANIELPDTHLLVEKINAQLGKVESIEYLSEKYKDALIVRVVTQEPHPDADKLSFCRIDDGNVHPDVNRDSNGLIEVVCGAPNIKAGQMVVWLPPGATVPSTFDSPEPFVLSPKPLRGIVSHGMIASARELGIGDEHTGIVVLEDYDLPPDGNITMLEPGMYFAEVFGLNDTILDIENKMFTHRPDCFGQLGVAREVSAILRTQKVREKDDSDTRFENPDWYWLKPTFESNSTLPLDVINQAGNLSRRFMAVAMSNVVVKPSPFWMQATLVRWGSKPINNVVDITNYIMLLTAQPTHAYDYTKLRGNTIGVRMAHPGETITLLNEKKYELTSEDLVIADTEGAIGLAGIMGGGNSEVSDKTEAVVLEVANFDMYNLRRSSMRHGLFTDALTRFNKGQSHLQTDRVLSILMKLMHDYASATQASDVYDKYDVSETSYQDGSLSADLSIGVNFINTRLGSNLNAEQIGTLLRSVNFAVYPDEKETSMLRITSPFWRTDIHQPEDIVEEVGRLYGYDALPKELPMRSIRPVEESAEAILKRKIRSSLATAGANELRTYSFVHKKVLDATGQDVRHAYRITNALSPDLQYYRISLLPSLLEKVHPNIKAGNDRFLLFEIGKGHSLEYKDKGEVPEERTYVDAIYASKRSQNDAAYYHLRTTLEYLMQELGIAVNFEQAEESQSSDVLAPFELNRTAKIVSEDNVQLGYIGELRTDVLSAFKLPVHSAAFTMNLDALEKISSNTNRTYNPLPKYPQVTQDMTLKISSDISYAKIERSVKQTIDQLLSQTLQISYQAVSIYQPIDDTSTKSVSFRFQFNHLERTLTDAEVAKMVDTVASSVFEAIASERV